MEFPVFQFVHLASCAFTGYKSEESYSVIFSPHHPIRYLYTFIRSLLSLLFPRLNNPSALSLSLCFRCSDPFAGLAPAHFMSLLCCGIRFTQKFAGSSFGHTDISFKGMGVHQSLIHVLHMSRRMMFQKQEKAACVCSNNYCFRSQLFLEILF